jgi:hypothetical protein
LTDDVESGIGVRVTQLVNLNISWQRRVGNIVRSHDPCLSEIFRRLEEMSDKLEDDVSFV